METLARYRKGIIAVIIAVVAVANAAGIVIDEGEITKTALAIFDSVAAALVILVPNRLP